MSTTPTRPPSLLSLIVRLDTIDRRQAAARERLTWVKAFDLPRAADRDWNANGRFTADAQLLTGDQQDARTELLCARRACDDLERSIASMETERESLTAELAVRLRSIAGVGDATG